MRCEKRCEMSGENGEILGKVGERLKGLLPLCSYALCRVFKGFPRTTRIGFRDRPIRPLSHLSALGPAKRCSLTWSMAGFK